MFFLLKSILFGEFIAGLFFALTLCLDWLISFLKVHLQKKREEK